MKRFFFFKTELTPNPTRIISLNWMVTDEVGIPLFYRDYLIEPDGWSIPVHATEIHGITNEECKEDGLPIKDVLEAFDRDLESCQIQISHNFKFHYHKLYHEYMRLNKPHTMINVTQHFCTMLAATPILKIKQNFGKYKHPSLEETYRFLFGIDIDDSHFSFGRLEALSKCYFELLNKGLAPYPFSKNI